MIYRGVVEDNDDPEKIGRVRVRIHGIHTSKNENSGEEFEFIKTSDLPWVETVGSNDFGLVGGIGISSVLQNGTWVCVVLQNEEDVNSALIIGTIKGINSISPIGKYSSGESFFDPNEKIPFECRSNESDLNRLVRSENLSEQYYDSVDSILGINSTAHQRINETLDIVNLTDSTSGANVSQTEPSSTSENSIYPENHVIETKSGHIIELDDSPNNERIRIIHKSGTYFEIKQDGSIVQKCVNENAVSHFINMGNIEQHIDKSIKNYIKNNIDEIIGGYVKRYIDGELKEHVKGNITYDSDGNVTWNIGGALNITVNGKVTFNSSTELDFDAPTINLN